MAHKKRCPECNGTGTVVRRGSIAETTLHDCPVCDGTGWWRKKKNKDLGSTPQELRQHTGKSPEGIMGTVGYGEENPAFRHGHNCRGKRSTEYESWVGIRARCLNPKNKLFPYYGGRGITMSPSWQESFSNFLTDMGMRPARGFSVERKNNNLGYSKENCIWANKMQQSRNRRNNIVVSFKGRSMCLKEACQIAGVDYKKAWRRFRAGWPVHLVLENG